MKQIYCSKCGKIVTYDETAITEKIFCNYCGTANYQEITKKEPIPIIHPTPIIETKAINVQPVDNSKKNKAFIDVSKINTDKKETIKLVIMCSAIAILIGFFLIGTIDIAGRIYRYVNKPHKLSRQEKIELKEKCDNYSYSRIEHHPEKYKGKYIQVHGIIIQVANEKNDRVTIRLMDDDLNVWYITYTRYEGEGRYVENDEVTVYGTSTGVTTYDTVRGDALTIPSIRAILIE